MSSSSSGRIQCAVRANELLGQIGAKYRRRMQRQHALDARIQKLRELYGPQIDQLKKDEDLLVKELTELVVPNFALLARSGTKTIYLRSGRIQLRRASQEGLLISEGVSESTIIARIARLGGLRRFTRFGKRTLNRDALKADPDFVAKVKDLDIGRKTSLIIKPTKAQGEEIVRELNPLSVTIPTDN